MITRKDSRMLREYVVVKNSRGRYVARRTSRIENWDQVIACATCPVDFYEADKIARQANASQAEARRQEPAVIEPEAPLVEVVDIEVQNEGTIYLFRPVSPRGEEWVNEHIADDSQFWGNAVVVEHRYIENLVAGAQGDGLVVR